MSMKGGHKLNKKITIIDPNDPNDSEKHFHPYTKESFFGFSDYGFFVGLGPLPERGNRRFQDFFCTVDEDNGKITKIEKYDTGLFARPVADKIQQYLNGFDTITYSDSKEDPLTTLDNMLNGRIKKLDDLFDEYYIYTFDLNHPEVKLLTHKVQKPHSAGGKRKTRRVKKSNRKSNRKRRSNTKRHTRKH